MQKYQNTLNISNTLCTSKELQQYLNNKVDKNDIFSIIGYNNQLDNLQFINECPHLVNLNVSNNPIFTLNGVNQNLNINYLNINNTFNQEILKSYFPNLQILNGKYVAAQYQPIKYLCNKFNATEDPTIKNKQLLQITEYDDIYKITPLFYPKIEKIYKIFICGQNKLCKELVQDFPNQYIIGKQIFEENIKLFILYQKQGRTCCNQVQYFCLKNNSLMDSNEEIIMQKLQESKIVTIYQNDYTLCQGSICQLCLNNDLQRFNYKIIWEVIDEKNNVVEQDKQLINHDIIQVKEQWLGLKIRCTIQNIEKQYLQKQIVTSQILQKINKQQQPYNILSTFQIQSKVQLTRLENVQNPYSIKWFANNQQLSALNEQTYFVINHQLVGKQIKCIINDNIVCSSKQIIGQIQNELVQAQMQNINGKNFVKFTWKYISNSNILYPKLNIVINYNKQQKIFQLTNYQGFYTEQIFDQINNNISTIIAQVQIKYFTYQQQLNIQLQKDILESKVLYQNMNQTEIFCNNINFNELQQTNLCQSDDYYIQYLQDKQTSVIAHFYLSTYQLFFQTDKQIKIYTISNVGNNNAVDFININKCRTKNLRQTIRESKISNISKQKFIQLKKNDFMVIIQEDDNYDFIQLQSHHIKPLTYYFASTVIKSQYNNEQYNINLDLESFQDINLQIYNSQTKQIIDYQKEDSTYIFQLSQLQNIQIFIYLSDYQFIINLVNKQFIEEQPSPKRKPQNQILLELSEEQSQELIVSHQEERQKQQNIQQPQQNNEFQQDSQQQKQSSQQDQQPENQQQIEEQPNEQQSEQMQIDQSNNIESNIKNTEEAQENSQ